MLLLSNQIAADSKMSIKMKHNNNNYHVPYSYNKCLKETVADKYFH